MVISIIINYFFYGYNGNVTYFDKITANLGNI